MANKVTMDFLAKELHISKTTVSKALNNCPGISPQTRDAITKSALLYGYKPNRLKNNVAVILPAVPEYFWGTLRKKLLSNIKNQGGKCSLYVYPNLRDTQGALQCIDEALSEELSVLILACPEGAEIKRRLEAVSHKILVLLIEQFSDITNTFFIGEDSYKQCFDLGEKYIAEHPDSRHFAILHATEFYTEKKRIEGFCDALDKHGKVITAHLNVDSVAKLQPSDIARQLVQLQPLPDCIFYPSGNVIQVCNAIKKLKSSKKIHCIGFDLYTRNDMSGHRDIITHVLMQDIDMQSKKAWEYAEEFLKHSTFPCSKSSYIEDIYVAL